ncbi:MAG: hypothetical protein R3190_01650 [Thermoanaerobaculia bacterium]|nr:hypothetical protein [Thermoanaerobaculia bacterium]
MRRLYYFTIEDEGILAESFAKLDEGAFAITYKVRGTEDVFVTTTETREAMDLGDVPYNLLGEEETSHVGIYHTPQSQEELGDYDDAIKALAIACRAIAVACVGVNGEVDIGMDLSESASNYSYFAAPAGHTFIFRTFETRDEAIDFVDKFTAGDKDAVEWAENLPLASNEELQTFN